jgi:two-component system, LytTR family, response regulator
VKVRAVIIDDDPYALQSIESCLSTLLEVEVLASFTDPKSSISFIKESRPDLLFLDIRMPEMSGFELMDEIYNEVIEVIFVTSFDEYAIKALRYSALDFLLKPVSKEDVRNAVSRYHQRTERILSQSKIYSLRQNLQSNQQDFELVLLTKSDGEKRFLASDIQRCEADSNYTQIFLSGQRKFTASKTLSDLEGLLDPDFFIRIHKSHLINKKYVKGVARDSELLMSDGKVLPISRRRLQEVRSFLSS